MQFSKQPILKQVGVVGYTSPGPKVKGSTKYIIRCSLGSSTATQEKPFQEFEELQKYIEANKPFSLQLPARSQSFFGGVKDEPATLVEPLSRFLQQMVFRPENLQDAFILGWLGLGTDIFKSVQCKSRIIYKPAPNVVVVQQHRDSSRQFCVQVHVKETPKMLSIISSSHFYLTVLKMDETEPWTEISTLTLNALPVVLDWDSDLSVAVVGFANGTVAMFHVDLETVTITSKWSSSLPTKSIKHVKLSKDNHSVLVAAEQKLFSLCIQTGMTQSGRTYSNRNDHKRLFWCRSVGTGGAQTDVFRSIQV